MVIPTTEIKNNPKYIKNTLVNQQYCPCTYSCVRSSSRNPRRIRNADTTQQITPIFPENVSKNIYKNFSKKFLKKDGKNGIKTQNEINTKNAAVFVFEIQRTQKKTTKTINMKENNKFVVKNNSDNLSKILNELSLNCNSPSNCSTPHYKQFSQLK